MTILIKLTIIGFIACGNYFIYKSLKDENSIGLRFLGIAAACLLIGLLLNWTALGSEMRTAPVAFVFSPMLVIMHYLSKLAPLMLSQATDGQNLDALKRMLSIMTTLINPILITVFQAILVLKPLLDPA